MVHFRNLGRGLAILLLAVLLALPAKSLVSLNSTTDVTMTGSAKQFQSAAGTARFVIIIAASGNAAVVRVGGSNVSSTVGATVAAGGGLGLYPIPTDAQQPVPSNNYYDLTSIWFYGTNGDKVSVIWGM